MAELSLREAVRQALREEMQRDKSVFQLGEDIGIYGGSCKVTEGLMDEFGPDRVMDTPIAEAGIIGLALGSAIVGMRPVAEIQTMDFSLIASDQIINQVAKMHYMSAGLLKAALVIRTHQRVLLSAGPHHSGKYEGLYGAIPGLMVVYPSTPYDAKGLLKSAIRDDNPVIFIEERTLYEFKGEVPDKEYFVPIGKADIKREGTDVTIVSYGRCFHEALRAAEILEADGINSEIVDLRTIQPMDKEAIINSLKKTGRLVIVHDACKTGGWGAEIAASMAEEALEWLEAPVRRIGALDTIMTFNPKLEAYIQPNADKIVKAAREVVQWSG
jgi:pyruvate dehydrogenase E1 component beta subunit